MLGLVRPRSCSREETDAPRLSFKIFILTPGLASHSHAGDRRSSHRSAARPDMEVAADPIRAFTLTLSHCLALQVAKDIQVFGFWQPSTLVLAAAIVTAHISSHEAVLVGLAASGMLVLLLHGSQSNHVLLEGAVVLAVLCTAPADVLKLPRRIVASNSQEPNGAGSIPTQTRPDGRERARRRGEWSSRLTLAMRGILVVLYSCTGFAKLNDDWHDPHVSCCVQMFVGSIAALVDVAWVPRGLLRLLPYAATSFELAFPVALLYAMIMEQRRRRSRSRPVLRGLALLGAAFHVLIALPPPPISVYPFSMLMAPIYIPALLPDDVGMAMRLLAHAPRTIRVVLAASLTAAIACALRLGRSSDRFEYPPYTLFSWELGMLWVLTTFGALVVVGVLAPATATAAANGAATAIDTKPAVDGNQALRATAATTMERASQPSPRHATHWHNLKTALTLLPAALILGISSTTYLGVRNYPSFAMFSNLRLEGGTSNHWIVAAPRWTAPPGIYSNTLYSRPPHPYSPHHAIEIVETDFTTLRDLQVNLAPLLPPHVLGALRDANVSAEFYITPPRWNYAPTENTFRPFSVPLLEVRRRLASAARPANLFVRYRWILPDGKAEARVRTYRRRGGARTASSDPQLDEPISSLRAMLHRYRTFDPSYSPCRH
jgi:hypothetical protein